MTMPQHPEISTGSNASAQPANPGPAQRPSLAGGSAGPRPVSMLASLERPAHRTAPRAGSPLRSRPRWPWIAAGGLLLAGLAAAGWHAANRASGKPIAPVSMTAALPNPAPAAPATEPSPTPPTAARVEVMEPATTAASSAPAGPAVVMPRAPIAAPASAASAALPTQRVAAATRPPSPVKPARAATKSHRDKRASPARAQASSRQAQEQARRDADAELLAALMAHVSPPRQAHHAPARHAAAGPVDKAAIAKQVLRCDTLARDASRRCRRHVCEGAEGKLKACPARAGGSH